MYNEKFWSFVKQMVTKHQSYLKPCKFYAENKTLVENEYKKFIKPSELIRTTRNANLDVIELIGLTYNPITKVYKLSKDTDVNYMVALNK